MSLFDWLLRKKWIKCPRCLGKGHVDLQDIERLKRDLFWLPGKCAYCKGKMSVPPDMPATVPPDLAYLSLDLPSWERRRLIKGEQAAFKRAHDFELKFQLIVAKIRQIHSEGMNKPVDIALHMYNEYWKITYTMPEFQQMVKYIERVIKK